MQEVPPTPHGGRNEIVGGQNLVEAFLRIFLQFQLSGQVIADARAKTCGCFLASLLHRVGELLTALGQLGIFRLRERHQPVVAAMKNTVERVVVSRRDGIVFVIVAARTSHGERHAAARHHVDAVIDDVVRHPDESPAAGDESHRRQVRRIRRHQLIRGHLQEQKAIVRQVFIEGANNPVAIRGRMNEAPFLAPVNVALRVRVTRDIQPMPAPAFAIARGGQEPFDEFGDRSVTIPARGLGESLHLLQAGWKPGEIETHPADQSARIRRRRRSHPDDLQSGEDESINISLYPARVFHLGRRDRDWRLKGPMLVCIGRWLNGGCRSQM